LRRALLLPSDVADGESRGSGVSIEAHRSGDFCAAIEKQASRFFTSTTS
jgi:hypothetical protein